MNRDQVISDVIDDMKRRHLWVQRALFVLLLGLFLGLLALFFFLSESWSAQDGRYIMLVLDVTGSTNDDRLENERGVIRVLDSLRPGDEGQVVLLTETSFSKPESVIRFRMPTEAGYFNEEIRKAKMLIIREFRLRLEKVRKSRAGTSLIDGMFAFGRVLSEHQGRRVLVLFSDMRVSTKDVNEDTIMTRGDEILSELKGQNLIPDMQGADVYCMGVGTCIGLRAWKKLEDFWRAYFSLAVANLKCYDIGRDRPIE